MKGGELLSPRTGRPKTENPRTERVSVTLTKEDIDTLKESREKDKEPEKTFVTWLSRKISELARKIRGKK